MPAQSRQPDQDSPGRSGGYRTPIAVRTHSNLTKRPGVVLPFAAFVLVDVLALLLVLEVWR